MSEHAWVLEHLAGYIAGGLEPDERDRLEQHLAACTSCAQALGAARAVDHTLEGLFAPDRPEAALEDRIIQALRAVPVRRKLRLPPFARVGAAAAALVLVGITGAVMSHVITEGGLPFPGMSAVLRDSERESSLVVAIDESKSMRPPGVPEPDETAVAPLDVEEMAQKA